MKQKNFYVILILITAAAFILRLYNFDKVPPINEAFDEVHYAWGGATWLKEGTPKSWSNFESYKNIEYLEKYGVSWRIVSPLVEKPPLYFLLSGLTVLLSGTANPFDVSHSVIRLLPLLLSIPTVCLVGVLGKKFFGSSVGLIACLIFATSPTIVLSNRMSVTENLLTPLFLATLLLASTNTRFRASIYLATASFLAILTKQIGVTAAIVAITALYLNRKFREISIVAGASVLALIFYASIGAFYDWQLFVALQQDVRIGHTLSGLPEMVVSIFRFPTVGPKNHPFIEGTVLFGYLLLFSAPLWLREKNKTLFLAFPFTYLLLLTIGQSGSTPFSFFGWYLYPLFPFVTILTARVLCNFWQKPSLLIAIVLALIIGSSTIRFAFLLLPREYHYLWQYTLIGAAVLFLLAVFSKKHSRAIILGFFALFVLINILVVLNLEGIYELVALEDTSLSGFND